MKIRKDKGFSQKYVAQNIITQGNLSKFEKFDIDIGAKTLVHILNKLELSFDEFRYIQNDYEYSEAEQLLNTFFNLAYNDAYKLKNLLLELQKFLECNVDYRIKDIAIVCEALLILATTNNIEKARIPLKVVWDRLSKRDVLYMFDIKLINTIMFMFPLYTALKIKKFVFRSIEKYKNYNDLERIKINIHLNIALMLLKEKEFNRSRIEIENAINLCKEYSDFMRLSICYIRKGISLSNEDKERGSKWIEKGEKILVATEENHMLLLLQEEISRLSWSEI